MIGDRMKEARIKLGYSAEQVAEFLGTSPATVYRYENGDISKLPSKFIKPLADFLCVTPGWLMGWSNDGPFESSPDPEISIVSGMMESMSKEQKQQVIDLIKILVKKG